MRSRVRNLWIIAAALLAAAGGASAQSPLRVQGIDRPPVAPGAYTTQGFRLTNTSPDTVRALARLRVPAGWSVVTPVRSVTAVPGGSVVVPFSVRSDPHARADTTYALGVVLTDQQGRTLARGRRAVDLRPTRALRIHGLLPPVRAHPGDGVDLSFRIFNEGNVAVRPVIEVETVPVCEVAVRGDGRPLDPGGSAAITARVSVRESLRPGQPLVVEVRASTRIEDAPVQERVLIPLTAPRPRVPTYRRLPTEVQTYHERTGDGRDLLGLRLNTGGRIGPETEAHLDLHLLSGDRSGAEEGWRRHRLRLDLGRPDWRATAGDLQRTFSDLTLRTLWGRGLAAAWEREHTTLAVVGMEDRDPQVKATYAAWLQHRPGHGWSLAGEWSHQRESADLAGAAGHRSLLASRARFEHGPFGAALSGAGSFRARQGRQDWGRAAQVGAAYRGSSVRSQLRAYTGSRRYAGANRDRDGWVAHLRWTPRVGWAMGTAGRRLPRRPLSLWVSHDAQWGLDAAGDGASTKRTRRLRSGGQLSWGRLPSIEVTAGHERVRRDGGAEDFTRRDLQISSWETIGRIMVSGFAQWGDITDHAGDRARPQRGWGLSAGGRAGHVHGTLRWSAEREYLPETGEERRRRTVTGDLAWSHPRSRWRAGVGLSSRWDRLSGGEKTPPPAREEWVVRPRVEWRIRPGLTLRYEHALREDAGGLRTETARLQLSWSSEAGLPIVWQPVRAGLAGTVFIDEDLDGRPDPGETALAEVAVILEGRQLVTDQEGRFAQEELEPGVYWLDLNLHTLPPGLVPLQPFPLTVTVDPGRVQEVWIPLVRASTLSGVVYRDRDHNGRRSPDEPGVRSVLVKLRGDGGPVRNAQTDETGAFRFQGMPPGSYRVELAHEWLPRAWAPTGEEGWTLTVAAGRLPDPVAIGIAPEEKPIVRTYSSSQPAPAPAATPSSNPAAPRAAEPVRVGQDTAPAYRSGPHPPPEERRDGARGARPRILRQVVATGVRDREPVGEGHRFSPAVRTLYFFTQVANPAGSGSLDHVWFYQGREMARVRLAIGGPTWRTWSSKQIQPSWTGPWRVQVQDEKGRVLAETTFHYED